MAKVTLARAKQVGELAPARLAEPMETSVWTPRRLNPVLWLSAGKGLYQDAAGTVPAVGENDPVGRWADEVTGIAATQAAAGSKPVLKPGVVNGRAAVRGDGSDDYVQVALTLAQPTFVLAVGHYLSTVGTNSTLYDGISINRMRLYEQDVSVHLYAGDFGPAQATIVTNWHIYSALFSGAQSELRVDGGAPAVGNAGTNSGNGLSLFAAGSGELSNSDLAEILIFNRALNVSERQRLERYFASQYGITLP